MRVMAYVHTFNDADVIEGAIAGILHQTRLPDGVLLVDNASTDGTLDRSFPERVSVIRNTKNLGSCGAIGIGLSHALEQGFDWMWLLDADSVPEPDALARLLELYSGWSSAFQEEIGAMACLPYDQSIGKQLHGVLFTSRGRVVVTPEPEQRYYMCHMTHVWSGSLYRFAAVRRVGLPNPDYFIDRGELEYMYRMMKSGYKAFIHRDAVLRHNVGGTSVGPSKRLEIGPFAITWYEAAPLRCYYTVRNTLYFTLYDFTEGRLAKFRELFRLSSRPGRSLMSGVAWQAALFTLNFALRPRTHWAQVLACFRGAWDGITGNIAARF